MIIESSTFVIRFLKIQYQTIINLIIYEKIKNQLVGY
jgi:hypothetical protein